jgi:hypothetical protein
VRERSACPNLGQANQDPSKAVARFISSEAQSVTPSLQAKVLSIVGMQLRVKAQVELHQGRGKMLGGDCSHLLSLIFQKGERAHDRI